MRLFSNFKGNAHHVTIPAHSGTLSQILADAAGYLELSRDQLAEKLFT